MDNPKIGDNKPAAHKQFEIKNNRVFLYMDGQLTHIFGTAPGVLENLKKMGYVDRYGRDEVARVRPPIPRSHPSVPNWKEGIIEEGEN